ncbi:MAG TPA: trans-aconitate 2-methyltransferase [Steroidobacteraceae bacterium]
MSWSAKQYVTFEDERTRPVRDLLGALPDIDAREVIDLGCGPGNSTEVLALRFPQARVSGIDSSADMIAAARLRLPRVSFALQEVQTWIAAGPFDVVLANAVLQWVPDHEIVLPSLVARLTPGGALAVQMPDNLDGPAHRLMREVAGAGPWAAKLVQARAARTALADAEWYYQLLRPRCSRVDLWRTTYYHSLTGGAAAIVEWFKGSGLRPYLEPLSETERGAYLARYTAAISSAYPSLTDGSVLLPFPRMFMVAIR